MKNLKLVKRYFCKYDARWIWKWYPYRNDRIEKTIVLNIKNNFEDQEIEKQRRIYVKE